MLAIIILSSLIGWFLTSRLTNISASKPTFLFVQYFLHFFILVIPGCILIYNGNRDDLALLPVSQKAIETTTWLICWSVIAFPATIKTIEKITKTNLRKSELKFQKSAITISNPKKTRFYLICLTAFNCILLVIIFSTLKSIPLFNLTQSPDELLQSRLESAFDLPPIIYGIRRFAIYLIPITSIFSYVISEKIKTGKAIYLANGVMAFFILAYSTEKAPIIYLIAAIIIAKSYNGKQISKKLITLTITASALALYLMFAIFYDLKPLDVASAITTRIFISQIAGTYLAVEHYGSISEFLYWKSVFWRLYEVLGFKTPLQPSEALVLYYYPDLYINNTWRNTNSFIIQGAYAAFSIPGAIIAPIICGTCYFVFIRMFNTKKNITNITIISYSSLFMISASTNFNNFIFSTGFIMTLLIAFTLRKIENKI